MAVLENRRPLVVVASEGEWAGRSLESVLELNGYTVVRCHSGRRALELARRGRPSALFLDESLPDVSGVEVARALRDDPLFEHTTPIVILAVGPAATGVRMAALAAGAWDYCTQPLDVEALLLKLETFIRSKHEADDALAKSLTDQLTGLYSPHGLQQLARQLGARAARGHEPFACVALSPTVPDDVGVSPLAESANETIARLAELWRARSRRSDIIGHLDRTRLAILAPETNSNGAVRLVERLRSAFENTMDVSGEHTKAVLRAGYYAVDDLAEAAVEPSEMMRRAERALDQAQKGPQRDAVLNYDQLPN
jgi:PleD family two-component response regulator